MFTKIVVVVIPAFNEQKTIGGVVNEVSQYCAQVVVVDDGSQDQTASIAENAGAVVLKQSINKGYDQALSIGFEYAYESTGADITVSFDADGQHSGVDIEKLVSPILKGEADLVLAQRKHLTHWSEKVFSLFSSQFGVKDPLCGLKAYDRSVYSRFGVFDTVGSIGTELSLKAIKCGFRPAFVGIDTMPRQDQSRFYRESLRANIKIIKALLRVRSLLKSL